LWWVLLDGGGGGGGLGPSSLLVDGGGSVHGWLLMAVCGGCWWMVVVLGTPHCLWVVLLGTQCWSSMLSSVVSRHWFSVIVVHCSLLSVTVHRSSVSSSSGVVSFHVVMWLLTCRRAFPLGRGNEVGS